MLLHVTRIPYQPLLLALCLLILCSCSGTRMPAESTQAIIGITEGWNSSHVSLSLVEKNHAGQWKTVLGPFKGRIGYHGTAWGRGLHSNPFWAQEKVEGDDRSPAGIFDLGGLYVCNPTPVKHDPAIPCLQVGPNDLWVSDRRVPHLYNRHVRLPHPARTPWQKHEMMNQRDYHHSIKMLVHHNTAHNGKRPKVGKGSSIFFHIWRKQGQYASAGCTTLNEENFRALIARLQAGRHPVYILLPREEYLRRRQDWDLP